MTGDVEPDPDAWDPHKRRSGYRALNLDVMKSAGERAIANWLIKSGVEFEYERPYEVNVADAQHSQYRPDFFYPSVGVYHEHWALVPGQAEPPGYDGYLDSSAWKKRVHSANGTTLIETAARDLADGSLFVHSSSSFEPAVSSRTSTRIGPSPVVRCFRTGRC